jgi:hypothetical protein
MAVHSLESIVSHCSTVEFYSKSRIDPRKIEDAVPVANDPEKRREASNRLSPLRSDRIAPLMRYQPATQTLQLGNATIRIDDYSEQQSLVDGNPNHYRGEIPKRLHHHYYLGNDRWDQEKIQNNRKNISVAHLKALHIKSVSEKNLHVVYAHIKEFLKLHDGSCVVSGLPKLPFRFRLVSAEARLANQEQNRFISEVLRQGETRNIGSLASSTSRAQSVTTTDTFTTDTTELDPRDRIPEWQNNVAPEFQERRQQTPPQRTESIHSTESDVTISGSTQETENILR